MSTLAIILIILGSAAAVWQLAVVALGVALLRANGGGRLNIGILPGIAAVILFIAAVLVG